MMRPLGSPKLAIAGPAAPTAIVYARHSPLLTVVNDGRTCPCTLLNYAFG
jgi:hypothetical protein